MEALVGSPHVVETPLLVSGACVKRSCCRPERDDFGHAEVGRMRKGEERQAARPAFGRVLGLVAGGIAAGDTTCGRDAAGRAWAARKV